MRVRASRVFTVEKSLPPPLAALRELSQNLYWSWNTDAAALFERIDRDLWQETSRNPVALLQLAPGDKLTALAADDYAWTVRAYDAAGNISEFVSPAANFTLEASSSSDDYQLFLPIIVKNN